MIKTFNFIIWIAFTISIYGQQMDFQRNVNYKAQILEQNLNEQGDILFLKSKTKDITQVDIFNDEYSKSYVVNSNNTDIDLMSLPKGNFIIQARLDNKRIIMYLEKGQCNNLALNDGNNKNLMTSDKLQNQLKSTLKQKDSKYFWIVYERNSGMGSGKSMKLVDKNELPRLIKKNKLELRTQFGKDNTLLVYEIYDKNKFMNKQFRNSEYYKTIQESNDFNPQPIYNSKQHSNRKSNTSSLVSAL